MHSPRTPPGANVVTIQVLDGVDKGRVFRNLPVPLTIGREEGNLLRLNDERVSRYHAKVLLDGEDLVLTDMESTNGTRVNGHNIQIRRLRFGDRITVGRSLLLFGSDEEINARKAMETGSTRPFIEQTDDGDGPPTLHASEAGRNIEAECDFDLNMEDGAERELPLTPRTLPPLPEKLTPGQAARLAEILDFLHQQLTNATENIKADEDGSQVLLSYPDWQTVLSVQNLLARYLRGIAEPDSF
jgi:pSer/pThr/pTyr-binding forkhead associated (FHA) protein